MHRGWRHVRYKARSLSVVTVLEVAMLGYFLFGAWLSWQHDDLLAIPFHLMQVTGFSMVLYYTVKTRG